MKLPPYLLHSQYFIFSRREELERAVEEMISADELEELRRVSALGLPPVTSELVLATMLGVNPGLIWSFINRPGKHYGEFHIPKGKGRRRITAPKVALKVVQKWLSVQLSLHYSPKEHVHGFVQGRSHVDAAKAHLTCSWVYSVDIENFFPSISYNQVKASLLECGYSEASSKIIASLTCLDDALPQGAPTSPVLSNMCFRKVDEILMRVAEKYCVRLSRYADDIVFSSNGDFPIELQSDVADVFKGLPWRLAPEKTELMAAPARRKVHGLLVGSDTLRLTKGYRNKLRAYRHLLASGKVKDEDLHRLNGHVRYGEYVESLASETSDQSI